MSNKKTKGADDQTSMLLDIEKKRSADYQRQAKELKEQSDARQLELKTLKEKYDSERCEREELQARLARQDQQLSQENQAAREQQEAERTSLSSEREKLSQLARELTAKERQLDERERRAPELSTRCEEAATKLRKLQREFEHAQQELASTHRSIKEDRALLDQDLQRATEREAAVSKREHDASLRESATAATSAGLAKQQQQVEQREMACATREQHTKQALAAAQKEALAGIDAQAQREAKERELVEQEQRSQLRTAVLQQRQETLARKEVELRSQTQQTAALQTKLVAAEAALAGERAALELEKTRWSAEVEARVKQAEAAERTAQASAVTESKQRCAELEARAQERYEAHIKAAQDRARDLEQSAQTKHDELYARAVDEDRRRREQFDNQRAEQEKNLALECERRLERARQEAALIEAQAAQTCDEAQARAQELARQLEELRKKESELAADTEEQEILTQAAKRLKQRIEQQIASEAAAAVEPLRAELAGRASRIQHLERLLNDETQKRAELDQLLTGAGNETLPKLRKQVTEARDRIRELEQSLHERPSEAETASLRQRAEKGEAQERANTELRKEISQLQYQRTRAEASHIMQQHERAITETLRATNQAMRQELDHLKQLVDQRVSNPLLAFQEVQRHATLPVGSTATPPPAPELMRRIRHKMAAMPGERARYYSESVVATFMAALGSTRMVILEGLSGTGKTSLPIAFAQAIGAGYEVVEVQSQWRDRGDLVGSYNPFHKRFYAQPFALALYRAGLPGYRERPFFIILDEFNLSQVEHYFADLLSLLQREQRDHRLRLVDDPEALANSPFKEGLVEDPRFGLALEIPPNVWFIGTANRDESTQPISDKVYDRAIAIELNERADRFVADSKLELLEPISFHDLVSLLRKVPAPTAEAKRPISEFLDGAVDELERRFRITRTNRFDDQWQRFLPAYLAALPASANGHRVGEALDHFLATKLLRPLRERFDPNLEEILKELRDDTLAGLWMPQAWGPFDKTKSFRLLDELIAKQQGIGYEE